MINFFEIIIIFCSYLLGSIPTAVWIGKIFYKIDVREFGSGNAGATNTFRTIGSKAGISVLIIDILKGFIAVKLVLLSGIDPNTNAWINFKIVLTVVALIGHIFPIFARFKGGKGVATLLGAVIAIAPWAAAIAVVVFIIVLTVTKYVSLASMFAVTSFPIVVIYILKLESNSLICFSILVAILLLATHHKNIERLINKKEVRFDIFSKSKKV